MKKVFIVNRGGHDNEDAERFGELVYLSEGVISRYGTTQIYRLFAEKLKDSSPDDYILPTGLSTMGHIACSMFVFLHGKLNLLLYKRNSDGGKYVERTLKMDELLKCERR
ncbi:MAG: hypothetical protein OS130_00805 [Thermodesulfobacteriota bacterium]|jgi:hypothetical protein|nr:MAG: hypothetical protein OS130_00805 [Thermodesulfobacteriota bacterium]